MLGQTDFLRILSDDDQEFEMAIALSLAPGDGGGASALAQIGGQTAAILPETRAVHAQDEVPSLATKNCPPPQVFPPTNTPALSQPPSSHSSTQEDVLAEDLLGLSTPAPAAVNAVKVSPDRTKNTPHTSTQEDMSAEDLLGLSAPPAVNAGQVYAAPAEVLPVEAVAPDDATSATNAPTPPLAQVRHTWLVMSSCPSLTPRAQVVLNI